MNGNEEKVAIKKKSHTRSPSYPSTSLEAAIVLAKQLYEDIGQTEQNIDVLLSIWGHNARSGHGLVKVASLIKFGLLEDQGSKDQRRAKLTPLALSIVLDEEKNSKSYYDALKRAALNPSIHSELWHRYSGSIPSDNTLRVMLVTEYKFSERGVTEFIDQFRQTIEFAKLNKNDNIIGSDKEEDANKPKEDALSDISFSSVFSVFRGSQMESNAQDNKNIPNEKDIINFPIPLTEKMGLIIRHTIPMSEEDWDYMMSLLEIYKKRLVKPKENKGDSN